MPNKYKQEQDAQLVVKSEALICDMPGFARKYFNSLRSKNMSELSILQYAYDIHRFFVYLRESHLFKDCKNFDTLSACDVLDKLDLSDLQDYIKTLDLYSSSENGIISNKKTEEATRARKMASLKSFLAYFAKINESDNNLSTLIDSPKIHSKEIVIIEKSEVERLIDAVSDTNGLSGNKKRAMEKTMPRDIAILKLFLGTGIRVSELVGADVKDVDFNNNSLLIQRKGGNQDIVYFSDDVKEALSEYMKYNRGVLLGDNKKETALFISMQHKRMDVRSVEKMIKGYGEKAGLNVNVTPHTLRRSFGSYVYEKSNDIYLTAMALNHSSVDTTKKYYAKMKKERRQEAAAYAADLIKKE